MDEMRAMLDELMGADRNLPPEERAKIKPKKRHYYDRDVCKYYLAGFCPYEEFRRTKNDVGECPSVHDEEAKAEWDALDEREKDRTGYDADLVRWLDRFLSDLRKRKQSNSSRLKAVEQPLFLHEDQAKLDAMSAQMKELLARAEKLGEEGDVDGALAATTEAERIKAQRVAFEAGAEARAGNNALKNMHQEVCPVSGLIINNDETRLRDHHQGRNYNAWKRLHETHARMMEELKARGERLRGAKTSEEPHGGRGEDRRREDSRERRRSEGLRYRDRSRERSPSRYGNGRDRRSDRDRRYDRDYRSSSYRSSDRRRYGDDDRRREERTSRPAEDNGQPEEGEL